MFHRQARMILTFAAAMALVPFTSPASAQRGNRIPDVGYVYPAGGQAGTQVTVTIGGQFLQDVVEIHVSGEGITAADLEFDRPLTNREVNIFRDKLERAREKLKEQGKTVNLQRRQGAMSELLGILSEMDVTRDDLDKLREYRQRRRDPKRQLNPQIEQTVTATLSIAEDAVPGRREIRVRTTLGISNPLGFHVSAFPEFTEQEPNNLGAAGIIDTPLPIVLNGQIMPGDSDRFRFQARKYDKLVLKTSARELMPYLADAVPGWFQATLTLYDDQGREVAFADDYRFHPDPVLFYQIPEDGTYEVEIKDAIFRGREDFVYRIELGELPFLKTVFPMGTRVSTPVTAQLDGWNLPLDTLEIDSRLEDVGREFVSVPGRERDSNGLPFQIDDFPEVTDQEPNDDAESAQALAPPCIVNGRIDQPGDRDVYLFKGRKGGRVVLEVLARRFLSPLDSVLKVTDADGNQIAFNDDTEDKGAGLATHHADSQLQVELPETGTYHIHLGDIQHKGSKAHVYRLRVSARQPDFELRVVPSSITGRPGSTIPITVYALRRDGFDDDIQLELSRAPTGFSLSGGWVPASQEKQEMTLSIPPDIEGGVYRLEIVGGADMRGRGRVARPVVPADDMMQAFIYRHLVPAEEFLVAVSGKALAHRSPRKGANRSEDLLKIPHGGTARYQLPIPGRRALEDLQIELKNPPEGITILRMVPGLGGLVILFSADAEKTMPGLRGNLLLDVYLERSIPKKGGRPDTKRKIQVGTFPAIPFKVTER